MDNGAFSRHLSRLGAGLQLVVEVPGVRLCMPREDEDGQDHLVRPRASHGEPVHRLLLQGLRGFRVKM